MVTLALAAALVGSVIGPVMADGNETVKECTTDQYGSTTCKTVTKPAEEVVKHHTTENTGLGENLILIAAMVAAAGLVFNQSAKLTKNW